MTKEKTHITILLDRSGSMCGIAKDMEGGINAFLQEQAKLPGTCFVSLHQFDDEFETVFEKQKLFKTKPVPEVVLKPRGSTALIDSAMKAITKAKENTLDKNIVVIITDGCENSSKECKTADVQKLIRELDATDAWSFVFLGADQDSFGEAVNLGMTRSSAMNYTKSAGGVQFMSDALSASVGSYRSGVTSKAVMTADQT